jgi:predicted glycosyltransferase involved in capsule biosynthesis
MGHLQSWFRWRRRHQISLLVPFRPDFPERQRNWNWLRQYWEDELPEAEIVMGNSASVPFCKTAAVNAAFRHAHGDIIVILDADCYISGDVIRDCAEAIRRERRRGRKLWYIPYRRFYRLNEAASMRLLSSDPADPLRFADPPPPSDLEALPASASFGHWYGALIQIMPRAAFIEAGGMDENFAGWGGEDVSFMHAVDTLYTKHRTFDGPVYHIFHPTIKGAWQATRQWAGQTTAEMNDPLSGRYEYANGDKRLMRRLIAGESVYDD